MPVYIKTIGGATRATTATLHEFNKGWDFGASVAEQSPHSLKYRPTGPSGDELWLMWAQTLDQSSETDSPRLRHDPQE